MEKLRPSSLNRGDKVILLTPAGKASVEKIESTKSSLEKLGLIVSVHEQNYYEGVSFAGSDEQRADALNESFKDESIKGIFFVRGGYGCSRILDIIDYDAIKLNPKVLVGMSDITVLQNAIFRKTGLISYSGPMSLHFMDSSEDFALSSLESILFNQDDSISLNPSDVISGGNASGTLIGGNLVSFNCLLGTEYLPKDDNIILFIEEIGEYRYAIDRALSHLKNSNVLDRVSGVIVGENIYKDKDPFELSIVDILKYYFPGDIPICLGAMFGHDKNHLVLPLGEDVILDVKESKTTLFLSNVSTV